MDVTEYLNIKIDLLINGVAIEGDFELDSRAYLDSISDGIHLIIFEDIYVTVSINNQSPYTLYKSDYNDIILLKDNNILVTQVKVIPKGKYFGVKTSDGTLMENIGTFQTDRVRISAFKGCNFVVNNEGCDFCEASYKRTIRKNRLEHISELLEYCEHNEERIKHYLISGGTPPNKGWNHFVKVCQTVRQYTSKPIYAMFSPPPKLEIVEQIVDSGVEDIAINIELFNTDLASKIIKGKNRIGLKQYFRTLEYAVTLLGNKGNVKSLLIIGLERYEDTLRGVEELAQRGVMPILSIFKPVKGTPLENYLPPQKEDLISIWEASQHICEEYNLTLGPLCKCCQNNTLTIPINNKYFIYE